MTHTFPQIGASSRKVDPILDPHIGRTLRITSRHLPWVVARQIHAQHQDIVPLSVFPCFPASASGTGMSQPEASLASIELDAFCWRLDVTDANVVAAQTLGWGVMRDLLILADRQACEALELCPDHAALPRELGFEVFEWP
ncbi:hypothetical protein EJP69_14340 [Variovorax gossypii]|uniref:Uncharacterized protein n=1 Tax=Variovorax gossypii TaxID=1679495 RepID=A0A3S0J2D0_9BURK|nr:MULTISPECIES: hypothetical protein [Variovorax]MDR6522169.1 hypothetical protein [Variovorax paradoxus]RTQ35533.1 hypothetical protein EJP69_14340 [Variovorax gossypii]